MFSFLYTLVILFLASRGFQFGKECAFWILYAKVIMLQSFVGRRPETDTSSYVKVVYILKIDMYSMCKSLGFHI